MTNKSNIQQAQNLLFTATYHDLDKIRECRAGLMEEYARAEQKYSVEFQRYEIARPTIYMDLKQKKVKGRTETRMSDMDIDRLSKMRALENNPYVESKSYSKVVLKYLDELRDLCIQLMHGQKQDMDLHYNNKNDKNS